MRREAASQLRSRVGLLLGSGLVLACSFALVSGCGDEASPPTPPQPAAAPENFVATVTDSSIHLTWTHAAGTPEVKVLRQLNGAPTGPDDSTADLVYEGAGTQVDDGLVGLLPNTALAPRTYHYAAFGCDASAACETIGSRTQMAPTVVQCLLAGGYTIYWRHALANVCMDRTDLGTASQTSVPNWWKSCDANCGTTATARQLAQEGIDQATTIGTDMRARGIPFGRVLSSEFCRCTRTAEYMGFDSAVIETDQGITFFVYDEAGRCAASMARLAEVPAPGTNSAVIGHAGFTCTILGNLVMGEAAVYKPDGAGNATFIVRVLADAWDTLE